MCNTYRGRIRLLLLEGRSAPATTVSLFGARIETGSIGLVCLFLGIVLQGVLAAFHGCVS